jgi:hypothetical protein
MSFFSGILKSANDLLYGAPETSQKYWGTPISNLTTKTLSPRFAQLILSIHKSFLQQQLQHDPRCVSFTGLAPGTFVCLVKLFPFVQDLNIPLPVHVSLAFKGYYLAMDMAHSEFENTGMPLLSDKGLEKWMLQQLWAHPLETVGALNTMLASTTTPLIDGSTGKEFLFKAIPDDCVPKSNADAAKLLQNDLQEWRKWLITQGRQMQQNQQQQFMQMQMQRQQNIQMMGLASQGAAMAQQQAWNMGINAARMSWGNF